MFEINKDILFKMGWSKYNKYPFDASANHAFKQPYIGEMLFYIIKQDIGEAYSINATFSKTLNKYKNRSVETVDQYYFISSKFKIQKNGLYNILENSKIELDSNIKLLSLLRDNLACTCEYQRLFQINSIFK